MTKQEIFDKVVLHARTQKEKATEKDLNICRYRTKDGLKCFIGALIPDDKYNPSMEGFLTEDHLISIGIPPRDVMYDKDNIYKFMLSIQDIHDYNDPDKWEDRFKEFAENNNLIYTPPE